MATPLDVQIPGVRPLVEAYAETLRELATLDPELRELRAKCRSQEQMMFNLEQHQRRLQGALAALTGEQFGTCNDHLFVKQIEATVEEL